MKKTDIYTIQFTGLADGEHQLSWNIEKEFFEDCDYPEIIDANLVIGCLLHKTNSMMTLDFGANGTVFVPCDRCLGTIEIPIDTQRKIVIKESEDEYSEDDDVFFVSKNDYKVSVANWLREIVLLAVPMRNVHDESDCDMEMISRLKELSVNEEKSV